MHYCNSGRKEDGRTGRKKGFSVLKYTLQDMYPASVGRGGRGGPGVDAARKIRAISVSAAADRERERLCLAETPLHPPRSTNSSHLAAQKIPLTCFCRGASRGRSDSAKFSPPSSKLSFSIPLPFREFCARRSAENITLPVPSPSPVPSRFEQTSAKFCRVGAAENGVERRAGRKKCCKKVSATRYTKKHATRAGS